MTKSQVSRDKKIRKTSEVAPQKIHQSQKLNPKLICRILQLICVYHRAKRGLTQLEKSINPKEKAMT
jgi:hypothetical protein